MQVPNQGAQVHPRAVPPRASIALLVHYATRSPPGQTAQPEIAPFIASRVVLLDRPALTS